MVNNLNDGIAWGLFPLFFAAAGLNVAQIGILSFLYPAVWGLLQLWTGALSDRWGRKWLIAGGMLVQGGALAAIALVGGFWPWVGRPPCSAWAPRWSTPRCWPPSATWRTRAGGPRR